MVRKKVMFMSRTKKILEKSIHLVAFILFIWILFLLFLGEKFIDYLCRKEFVVSNIIILILFVFSIILCYVISKKKSIALPNCSYGKIVKICTVLLFFSQIYICYNIFFETGWDSGGYVIPAARALLENRDIKVLNEYFSMYPNNLFLVNIYYFILKINNMIGIITGEYQLMAIVICNCIISSISCWLVYKIGSKKFEEPYAFTGYVISVILVGLSPWMVICYSDALVLFLPILCMYIYMNERIPFIIKYLLIFLGGYFGYCIKPQSLIVVIAIVVVEFIKRFGNRDRKDLQKDVITISISAILIVLVSASLHKLYQNEGFETDSDRKFGISHFFMMGLNPDRLGIWCAEDIELSNACKNQNERKEKNIKVSLERLKNYGIFGYINFLSKKMLINYNDGTFAWGVEGDFYYVIPENINTQISGRMKEVYYTGGSHFWFFCLVEQFVWICVIILIGIRSFFALFVDKESKDYEYLVMILSIIGLTMFELLFEARARYLYIYVPIFILVAVYGIRDMKSIIKEN